MIVLLTFSANTDVNVCVELINAPRYLNLASLPFPFTCHGWFCLSFTLCCKKSHKLQNIFLLLFPTTTFFKIWVWIHVYIPEAGACQRLSCLGKLGRGLIVESRVQNTWMLVSLFTLDRHKSDCFCTLQVTHAHRINTGLRSHSGVSYSLQQGSTPFLM